LKQFAPTSGNWQKQTTKAPRRKDNGAEVFTSAPSFQQDNFLGALVVTVI
jgi:hypothetical protein